MADQQLKVCARYAGLRCSESGRVEADIITATFYARLSIEAVKAYATVGEKGDVFRDIFVRYKESNIL
jgi:hypothetical protein